MDKKQKRGRPAFTPTADQRKKVEISVAFGMAHDDIALALGIARQTLLKYFDTEISIGAAKRRMEVLAAMHKTALKGNVSAQRALLATVSTHTVPRSDTEPAPAPAAGPVEKVGKKEAAQAAAKTAEQGTDWADILKPPGTQLQ